MKRKYSKQASPKYKNTYVKYKSIQFKSKLEANCYKIFLEHGYELQYENYPSELQKAFYPNVNIFLPDKGTRDLIKVSKKILGINYKVDFYLPLEVNNRMVHIFIEAKGKPNDVYPIKKKMFIKTLEESSLNSNDVYFFEVHNIKQIHQAIEIIKTIS